MDCNVLNPANGKNSVLHEKLVQILGSSEAADVAYAKISGPDFMERFGDWGEYYKNPTEDGKEKIGAVMPNGEPELFLNKKTNQWYFKDKDNVNDYLDKTKFLAFTTEQVKITTNHLLYRFVLESGKKSFNEYDPSELEQGQIMKSIENSIEAYKESIKGKEDEAILLNRIKLVEKDKIDFRDELINYIEQIGFKVQQRITDAEGNSITEVAEEDRGGGLNIEDSIYSNSKESATVNTKILLSQIPLADENLEAIEDGFLNVPAFADFNDVWTSLQKLLVDEVGYGTAQEVVDIFDVMFDKIQTLSVVKPWAPQLISKLKSLKSSKDHNKINEFVQAFNKTHLNFFVTEYNKGKYSVINATATNSRQSQITNTWNNSFFDKYIKNGQLRQEEKEEIQSIRDLLDEIETEYNAQLVLAGNDEELQVEAMEEALVGMLTPMEHLGMKGIEGGDIMMFISQNGGYEAISKITQQLFDKTGFLLDTILSPKTKFVENGIQTNVFNTESSLKKFAEAISIRLTDIADSSVLLNQGKSGYTYTNPTFISNKINEWIKDPKQLDDMSMDPSKKNSLWLAHLRESQSNRENFKAGLDSSFKSKGKNDGVENTKITLNDNINANVAQMLGAKLKNGKSFFPTIIAADKSRRILFDGLPMFDSRIETSPNGELYISQESVDVALGYLEDEYNRMKKVTRELADENNQGVVHYHTGDKNGLRSQIFPEFDFDGKDERFEAVRDLLYGEALADTRHEGFTPIQIEELEKAIRLSIKERVKETNDTLSSLPGLSRELVKAYEKDMGALAGDYFMNGLISSVEYTKLFSGDPAYYKNTADLIKRIPATYTDGLQLRLDTTDSLIFNQATIEGVEVSSKYLDKIKASVKDKSIAKAYERNTSKKQNGVNTTDAQAWITPRRWKFLKEKLGQWGPEHDIVFNRMMRGKTLSKRQMKLAAQPLKGVYFEINEGRPVYLKYSQAVLIPHLVKGTPMQALYDKMVNDPETGLPHVEGFKEIHEVVTLDGVKVGAVAPTKINIGNTTDIDPNFTLNKVQLSNRGWKLQQDLPIKLMHETNLGSQIQKNILEGISLDGEYGTDLNGRQLVQRIHNLVSELSNFGKQELTDKFGIDQDGKMTDQILIYDALIQEFKDRGGNENIVSALQKGMKFDAIPQIRGRVESIFMSIMNKALIKISTEGGSFIQVSPFGLETISEDSGITIVSDNYDGKGLQPPRIDKKTGKVLPGQAMIPHSKALEIWNEVFPDKPFDASKLDASALELISYRIPNQGMSSNDYLEIIGILPEGMGDSIIAYDGLPAKTGSDFDIDKLFVMQNSLVFNTDSGMIEKLSENNRRFGKGNIEKKLVQNELFDSYKKILNSPLTYDNMMRSIDGSFLKDDINDLFPAPEMKNMQLFSPLQQLKSKFEYLSGKFGVAQTANQLVDHVSNQTLDLRLDSYIGQGNVMDIETKNGSKQVTFFDTETTDSNSIATSLSAFLNAYVDIAKDPYITRGNHNSVTANTAFMLIRSGVDLKWVNRFIGQPILKELVELTMAQNSITAKDLKTGVSDVGGGSAASPIEVIREKYGFKKNRANASSIAALTSGKLEKNIKKGNDTVIDAEVLNAWEFLSDKAKSFGEGVMAAKSDTKGAGGSNVERIVNANKIRKVLEDGVLVNYESKFNDTALDTYKKNSLGWTKKVIRKSELFLSGTKAAEDVFNAISLQTDNGKYLVNVELGKAIDGAFYSYTMSGTAAFINNIDNFNDIITKVPAEVVKRRNEIIERGQEAINNGTETPQENYLLQELEVNTRNGRTFLSINNKNKPRHYDNKIYRDWMALYNSFYKLDNGRVDNSKMHPDRKLAIDLVKYAFATSGFQNNLSQFFTHIPHEILRDLGLNRDIRGAIQTVSDIVTDNRFVDQFQRHSKNNKRAVKSVGFKQMEGNYKAFVYKPSANESQELGTPTGKQAERTYPRFVKATQRFTDSNGIEIAPAETHLFEMRGTVSRTNWEGKDMDVPVYSRTYELGLSEGKHKLVEYSKDSKMAKSQIPSNNVQPKVAEEARKFISDLKVKEEFKSLEEQVFAQEEREGADYERESEETFLEKIAYLTELMDVEVVMDESVESSRVLGKNDPRTKAAGKPVILINPNQLFTTTAIHEFGHIFIDSFPGGLKNPRLQKALQQLMGTELEKEIRELYPDLTEEQFAKELITTALGREGADIWAGKDDVISSFEAFKRWFFDFIRRTFGIDANVARSLAAEMLTNRTEIKVSDLEMISQELRKKKDLTEIDTIEQSIDKVYKEVLNRVGTAYNIQLKKTESAKQRERANVRAGVKTRLLSVTELQELLKKYDEADKRKGLIKYLRWAGKEVETMNKLLDVRKKDDEITVEAIKKASNWNDSFNMVNEVQNLMNKMHNDGLVTDKERDSLSEVVGDIQATRSLVESKLIEFARSEYAQVRAKVDTEISEIYRQDFKDQWAELENNGGSNMQEGEFVVQKMNESKDEIYAKALTLAQDRAERALGTMSWISLQALSEKSMKSKDIQMVSTIIDEANNAIERAAMDTASKFNEFNKEHREKISNSRNQKEKYKGMFITTKSGQSYYTTEYHPEFYETRKELIEDANNTKKASEKYSETELVEVRQKDGTLFNYKYKSAVAGEIKPLVFERADTIRAEVSENGGRPTHVTYKKGGQIYRITMEEAIAKSELQHWTMANTVASSNKIKPTRKPSKKWLSDEYKNMTEDQRKSWRALMTSVFKADANYDSSSSLISKYNETSFIRLPGAMASDTQRIQDGQGKSFVKHKVESLYKTQADEYDIEGVRAHTNVANKEQLRVPVPYRARLKAKDQSFDLHTITLMNEVMSINYKEKKSIEGILQIIDMVAKEKSYPIYDKNGEQAVDSVTGAPLFEKNPNDNISKKISSIIENRLYGVKTKQAKNINKNVETQKVMQSLMKYFGAVSLVGNFANSIVNTTTGTISNLMEAIGGDTFTLRDWRQATQIYWKDMKHIMADMGSNVVTSKTNMLMSSFNIMGGMEYIQNGFEENTAFEGLMKMNSLRPFAKAGEHMMQGKTMYSVLNAIKVQNEKGQWINSEGKVVESKRSAASMQEMLTYEKSPNGGLKLVLNRHVQNTSFTTGGGQAQIMLETRNLIKSKIIELHGNYDAELQSHAQRYVLGKMIFFLRKWMEPGLIRRWRGFKHVLKSTDELSEVERYYSADQKDNLEGYYTTGVRFLINLFRGLKEGQFELIKNYDNLSNKERANLKKLLFDAGMIILTMAAYGALDDEDDPDKNIVWKYLLRRQQSELQFFYDPFEAFKIVSTPTAAVGNVKQILKTMSQLVTDPTELYEQGAYKGESKLKHRAKRLAPRIKNVEDMKQGLKFLNNMSM